MSTSHRFICANATKHLALLEPESVNLILTSPPYPMIEMWDDVFASMDSKIRKFIPKDPSIAFDLMHRQLSPVWEKAFEVLQPGGHLVINIGDATRTIAKNFQLFSNHSRILQDCIRIGFQNLPNIIWRKQTNAPNKFMGSGMLPPGAYVTLEHEYILILRKGEKRAFKTQQEKKNRSESAYFWEERNTWFSDIWDFKGARQVMKKEKIRERSGAFPFELAYRIINMFSVKGDMILDPFGGTGTTAVAAIASERNSIHIEIDTDLNHHAFELAAAANKSVNDYIHSRMLKHLQFVSQRKADKKEIKHYNKSMNTPVITSQEKEMKIYSVERIQKSVKTKTLTVEYSETSDHAEQHALAF